jgi:hypothetical protein
MAKEATTTPTNDPAALLAELEALRAQNEHLQRVANAVEEKPKIVPGTFTAKTMVGGKVETRKFRFLTGAVRLRFPDGSIQPTEVVMRLASGGKVTAEERRIYHNLDQICNADGSSNGAAEAELQRLADIQSGIIEAAG